MNRSQQHRRFEIEVWPLRSYIKVVAATYLDDRSSLADLLQIVLLKAWKSFDSLPKVEHRLKKWLYIAVRRAAIDHGRLQRRQGVIEHSVDISGSFAYAD